VGDFELLFIGAIGLLLLVLGVATHRVRPNAWYRVRTGSTDADEQVWRDANRRAGRHMERVGAGVALLSVALIPAPDGPALTLAFVLLVASTLALTLDAVLHARRRSRRYREEAESGRG
jgi:uncharacterized membrane protein